MPTCSMLACDKFLQLGGKREAVILGGVGVEARLPEITELAAGADTAESQDVLRSRLTPEHAGLFATRADDGLAAGFDDSRTDEEAPAAEGAVLHALDVANEVPQFFLHRFGPAAAGAFLARGSDELLDLIPQELSHPLAESLLEFRMVLAAQQGGLQHFAGMLPGVVEVHDLEDAGKAEPAHVGQPVGAVDEQHHEEGQGQPPADTLLLQKGAEFLNRSQG